MLGVSPVVVKRISGVIHITSLGREALWCVVQGPASSTGGEGVPNCVFIWTGATVVLTIIRRFGLITVRLVSLRGSEGLLIRPGTSTKAAGGQRRKTIMEKCLFWVTEGKGRGRWWKAWDLDKAVLKGASIK